MRFYHLLLGVRAHLQTAKLLLTPSSARQFHPGMQGQSVQNAHYLSTQDVSPNTGPGWGGKKKKRLARFIVKPFAFQTPGPRARCRSTAAASRDTRWQAAFYQLVPSPAPLLKAFQKATDFLALAVCLVRGGSQTFHHSQRAGQQP